MYKVVYVIKNIVVEVVVDLVSTHKRREFTHGLTKQIASRMHSE